MLTLRLQREPSSPEGTFGSIVLPEQRTLYTAELPWHDNARDISCIPPAVYRCSMIHSPKHHELVYLVENVPGRDMIEIHRANFSGDRALGWYADLLGCIAPGLARGVLKNPDGKMQRAVLHSRSAIDALLQATHGEPFMLQVVDAHG